MKRTLCVLLFLTGSAFTFPVLAQEYSIRTNVLNIIARGPSVTFGKNMNKHSGLLLTWSFGRLAPFFLEDSYKYSTLHAEYRWHNPHYTKWKPYAGAYSRYIHKRIFTTGYEAGPYGIFSKAPRNFIGNGLSAGLTSGMEWSVNRTWFIDFNTLLGAGKYLSQIDYAGHDRINFFLDTRIALQIGFRL